MTTDPFRLPEPGDVPHVVSPGVSAEEIGVSDNLVIKRAFEKARAEVRDEEINVYLAMVDRCDQLVVEVQRLRIVCENFAFTAERAIAAHYAPKTGMQVPFHGDFCNVMPSTITNLEWWAKRFREALAGKP